MAVAARHLKMHELLGAYVGNVLKEDEYEQKHAASPAMKVEHEPGPH